MRAYGPPLSAAVTAAARYVRPATTTTRSNTTFHPRIAQTIQSPRARRRACMTQLSRSIGLGGQRREHVTNLFDGPGHFGLGDDIGRHEIEDVAERTKEQAPVEKGLRQPRADAVKISARLLAAL